LAKEKRMTNRKILEAGWQKIAVLGLVAAASILMAAMSPGRACADEGKPAQAHPAGHMPEAVANMAAVADHFWQALTPEQQGKAGFAFNNEERFNWHFIPRERKGLTWNEMTPAQQALGHALMASGLSLRGYEQATTIMSLEQILKDVEQGKGPKRDAGNYAFSIFGKPEATGTWGWRVEGHHFSMNFTISNGQAVAGPVFLGTNPAEVKDGPRKGLRVIDVEEDLGFELVKSLDEAQQKQAILDTKAPKEIITGNNRKADIEGPPKGIALGDLKDDQKKLVMRLVEYYAHRLRNEVAAGDMDKIRAAGVEKIHFAWAGGTEPGIGHYYRLQGPTFLVEFDNTQNNANHIHTVWRDPANDFGEDLLREHYETTKH
jgi:hypothetical protein